MSLKEIAATKGLFYGAAVNSGHVVGSKTWQTSMANLVKTHCNIITAESDTQWFNTRPDQSTFNFSRGDSLAAFAATNSILMRGHTLVWHTLPEWVSQVPTSELGGIFTHHIATSASHFQGKIAHWNVVNEVASPSGLRNTIWLQNLGESYIDEAFRIAAEYSTALRFYNENRMEYDTWEMNNKRSSVLRLLERLVSSGVPIQGLGIQAHLFPDLPFSETKYSIFLREVAAFGLKILITECDVTDQTLPADIAIRDQVVADTYRQYLDVALAEPAVMGLITWGISDAFTWLKIARPRSDGLPVRPLLFDDQYQPKPAYYAVQDAFANAPER